MIRRIALALSPCLLVVLLCGFVPFTRVTSVCPECPEPKTDVLVLENGFKVQGNVVARNRGFYVVERYGEYRAVARKNVASVKWKRGKPPAGRGTGTQVLLKDNVVLHGVIASAKAGRYLVIETGPHKHVVWLSQIQAIYRAGAPYTPPR